MSKWKRGDWDCPNYYERRRREDEDKFIRQIAPLMREMVVQEPFGEVQNWAMQMNAHFEGEDLNGVVATTVRSRRIILIIDHDLQFDDLVRLVRRVDAIQQTHFHEPTWEVEFAVRGRIDPGGILVPCRRRVDDMVKGLTDDGHYDRINAHLVRSISNHEFNLLMTDADRYR